MGQLPKVGTLSKITGDRVVSIHYMNKPSGS